MAPVWTVLTETPIRRLSDWWADALSRNYEFAREDFRKALYEEIKKRAETTTMRIVVSVDYDPYPILAEALKRAGIPWKNGSPSLPMKTSSCIELNGRTWVRHTSGGDAEDLLPSLVMSKEEVMSKIFNLPPDALPPNVLNSIDVGDLSKVDLEDLKDLRDNKSGLEIMRTAFDDLRKLETLVTHLRVYIYKHLGEDALIEADPQIGIAELEDTRILVELEKAGSGD